MLISSRMDLMDPIRDWSFWSSFKNLWMMEQASLSRIFNKNLNYKRLFLSIYFNNFVICFRDVQKKLEQEINELKNDNSKEKQYLLSKISQLECERSELEIKERNIREALELVKEERNKFETELRAEWQAEKEANQKLIDELQNKLLQNEENLKEVERRIYLNDSENEKEKALLQQKIVYYEKSLEELTKKEKELTLELKNAKKEHLNQLRENSVKYETLNKTLQLKVDQLQEKVAELEVNLEILCIYDNRTSSLLRNKNSNMREETGKPMIQLSLPLLRKLKTQSEIYKENLLNLLKLTKKSLKNTRLKVKESSTIWKKRSTTSSKQANRRKKW